MVTRTKGSVIKNPVQAGTAAPPAWPLWRGAASTAFPLATDAALEILRAGGNAVDAAVAAAWALSACEPSASGLGGQTTLLLYEPNGTVRVIDGHSHAPVAASPEVVDKGQQRLGYCAATIPSTPATLSYAQRKYGLLRLSQTLAPAIRIAEEGYPVTPLQHRQTLWVAKHLRASSAASHLFLRDGIPPRVGEIFRQPELAATLRRLADHGVHDFYHGEIARQIAQDMQLHGGLITKEDLAASGLPVEREAVSIHYRGLEVISIPPPGGGWQVLLALKIMEQLALSAFGADATRWYEIIALAIHATFRERQQWPLGPDDFTPSLRSWILGGERAQHIAFGIRNHGRVQGNESGGEEPGDTTHLTVADRHGNVVSLTQSIQSVYGAKVANPKLGFLYNNYLCTCPRYPHPYQFGSRCVPRSNVAPTLVLQKSSDGKVPLLALGAAGSRRITSAILQVVSGVIDRGLSVAEAVAAPRLHALLNRKVWLEQPAASRELLARLQERFWKVEMKPSHSFVMGSVQALQWLPDRTVAGAADPRRDGAAATLG